jgi:hypothetical protein
MLLRNSEDDADEAIEEAEFCRERGGIPLEEEEELEERTEFNIYLNTRRQSWFASSFLGKYFSPSPSSPGGGGRDESARSESAPGGASRE